MLTQTLACRRFVLVRTPQCKRNLAEVVDGIEAAHSSPPTPDSFKLTEDGAAALRAIHAGIGEFVVTAGTVGPSTIRFTKPVFVHDGSDAARNCLAYLGLEQRQLADVIDEPRANPDEIEPIVVFASSSTIRHSLCALAHFPVECAKIIGPTVASVTMIDVHDGDRLAPFVHCIGNTVFCPEARWWNNAP